MTFLATQAIAANASCRVLDGNTYVCLGERIRLHNADEPKLHARCASELETACAATRFAQAALDSAHEIKIEIGRPAHGRYGRTLARVAVGTAPTYTTTRDMTGSEASAVQRNRCSTVELTRRRRKLRRASQ